MIPSHCRCSLLVRRILKEGLKMKYCEGQVLLNLYTIWSGYEYNTIYYTSLEKSIIKVLASAHRKLREC